MPAITTCDVAIVGGGLSGSLFALALAKRRPDIRLRLIEGEATLGGNHVWSFFGSDVPKADRWLIEKLVSHGWRGYDVAFPNRRRTIDATYYSIESERLDRVVRAELPPEALMFERKVLATSPSAVVLANGERVEAGGVIDCRGPRDMSRLHLGWQKFVGRELLLDAPHGLERPVIMDATVPQIDGYRFVYLLPFAPDRVFVEDTYYSDSPAIDHPRLVERIDAYAAARGWRVKEVLREETGVLPVVIGGDFESYWLSGGNRVAKGGARAGLFHPTTGYSLPDAVRAAIAVAGAKDLSGTGLHDLLHEMASKAWRERGFYRMLDAMLFRAAEPAQRYRVLEHFYGLDPKLIGRFYAARSTLADKARVLMGKPPVPVGRALDAILRAPPPAVQESVIP